MRCSAGADAALAEQAARWAEGFHPPVRVAFLDEWATLTSETHDEAELHAIWRSALLTEKLTVRGASPRAAVIAALVQ